MEELFEIGDTVRLISGGPLMTVSKYTEASKEVTCIWFNALDDKCESTFDQNVLIFDFDADIDDDFELYDEDFDDEDLDLEDDNEQDEIAGESEPEKSIV
jgi:uncharacterized protein YodC (DUF2158 family)